MSRRRGGLNDDGTAGAAGKRMTEDEPENLVEIRRCRRRREVEELGLVLLAMGIEYWIFRKDGGNVLCVEERNRENAVRESEKFETERATREPPSEPEGFVGKTSNLSLFVFGWSMGMFFLAQEILPAWWVDRGAASSDAILRGQWWRALTALTLHANTEHLLANLATGLVFAAFLVPLLGTGLAWCAIILSGALGNLINAWFYRHDSHESIGASTAVFGALGLLVAWQVCGRILALRKFRAWELIVPAGAGLALLGYLGTSGEQVDFLAHFFGFVAGNGLGASVAALRLEKRATPVWQRVLAGAAFFLPLVAWAMAARHR